MVYHLGCHTAVRDEILPGYKTGIVACQKERESGDVFRLAHSPGGVLLFIRISLLTTGYNIYLKFCVSVISASAIPGA
jgi:hypothetical protein